MLFFQSQFADAVPQLRAALDLQPSLWKIQALLGSLCSPELFWSFHVLCTNEWGYNTEADGFYIVSDRRRAEESQAIAGLTRRYPEPADQVRAIESLIEQARSAGCDPVSVDSVLSHLCQGRAFLSAFSEHLLADNNSVLRQIGGIAIRAWRAIDKAQYLRFGIAFISIPNDRLVLSVALRSEL